MARQAAEWISRDVVAGVTYTGHNDALLMSWATSAYPEGGLRYYERLFWSVIGPRDS